MCVPWEAFLGQWIEFLPLGEVLLKFCCSRICFINLISDGNIVNFYITINYSDILRDFDNGKGQDRKTSLLTFGASPGPGWALQK